MFFVINKEKLTAYTVSVFTVIALFIVAGVLTPKNETIETSANIQNVNTNTENANVYNNITQEIQNNE